MRNYYYIKLTLATKKSFVVCVFLFLTVFSSERIQAQSDTLPAGSLIIDISIAPQTIINSLRPYALVYRLPQERVPVVCSIYDAKIKNRFDFTIGSTQFRGGPLIVRAENLTSSISINNIKSG